MDNETRTHRIGSHYLETIHANLAKINAKAAKLGLPPAALDVSDLIEIKSKDEFDRVTVKTFYDVTLVLSVPLRLAGWSLVAALDHTIESGIVISAVPGETVPPGYRDAKPVCDHCGYTRRRNETFLVRHEGGEVKQVGRNCIADFLGVNAEAWLRAGTYLRALEAFGEDLGGWGRGETRYLLDDYLTVVTVLIRKEGWVSRKVARERGTDSATADTAMSVFYLLESTGPDDKAKRWAREIRNAIEPRDREKVEAALAWIRAKAEDPELNDYLHNLVVLTAGETLATKHRGVVASLIATYDREMGIIRERKAAATSAHVGTVGKRTTFEALTVTDIKTFETDGYGRWGHGALRSLVSFLDANGNRLKWWTGETDLEEGKTYTGKATVKEHEVYKGINFTVLSRAALSEVEAPSLSPAGAGLL